MKNYAFRFTNHVTGLLGFGAFNQYLKYNTTFLGVCTFFEKKDSNNLAGFRFPEK